MSSHCCVTGSDLHISRQHFEGGRLSSSVHTKQAETFSAVNSNTNVVHSTRAPSERRRVHLGQTTYGYDVIVDVISRHDATSFASYVDVLALDRLINLLFLSETKQWLINIRSKIHECSAVHDVTHCLVLKQGILCFQNPNSIAR